MKALVCAAGLSVALALTSTSAVLAQPVQSSEAEVSPTVRATLQSLVKHAFESDVAYNIVEGLTTEVGPRLAGSLKEAEARVWAVAKLEALGFQNVRVEAFEAPYWSVISQSAEIVAPNKQALALAALGDSGPTPPAGVEGDVVRFASVRDLQAAPGDAVRGKIVFLDEKMVRAMDGAGYGPAVAKRRACPQLALERGALACLIRSVGTDSHRMPHQGQSGAKGLIPAAALSAPDADQLARLLNRGAVRLNLKIAVDARPAAPSGNVIGEIVGREKPDEIVLLAAHLDSWDLGTGAIDDASGVGIVTAAAKLIGDLPKHPKRTIRVLLAGAEETGVHGGAAYGVAHAAEANKHVVAAESDFGAGRVWRVETKFGAGALPYAKALQTALAPLQIVPGGNAAGGGADIQAMAALGVPIVDLDQDGTDYFDLHHTADDTLDKVDPAAIKQNVAAWVVFAYLAAETGWDFR
jgi:carboxypeptidase Q